MATSTYIPLASVTLTGDSTSINFNSIDQSYSTLVFVAKAKSSTGYGATQLALRFNGDTGANYGYRVIYGSSNGSSYAFGSDTGSTFAYLTGGIGPTETDSAIVIAEIYNYTDTGKDTMVTGRSGRSSGGVVTTTNRWNSTAAVTSIEAFYSGDFFAVGSTFELWGIA